MLAHRRTGGAHESCPACSGRLLGESLLPGVAVLRCVECDSLSFPTRLHARERLRAALVAWMESYAPSIAVATVLPWTHY